MLMDNVFPKGNQYQSVTSPSGGSFGRDVLVRRYEHIKNYPQQLNLGFRDSRKWNSDSVLVLVYMIQSGDHDRNVYTYDILSLMVYWNAKYCMDTLSKFHMREYYALKYQIHDNDTPTYTEALSG